MTYTGKEILNDLLHIVAGFFLAWIFIPSAAPWIILLFVLAFAAVREHIQVLRGHVQKNFHIFTDPLGFLLGAMLFVLFRRYLPHTNTKPRQI